MNPVFERWILADAAERSQDDGRPHAPWHSGQGRSPWRGERKPRSVAPWQLLGLLARTPPGANRLARSGQEGRIDDDCVRDGASFVC